MRTQEPACDAATRAAHEGGACPWGWRSTHAHVGWVAGTSVGFRSALRPHAARLLGRVACAGGFFGLPSMHTHARGAGRLEGWFETDFSVLGQPATTVYDSSLPLELIIMMYPWMSRDAPCKETRMTRVG